MARLIDVVSSLGDISLGEAAEVEPTIFAQTPWTPASSCLVLAEETVNGCARSAPGYEYFLEVDVALTVLGVWSAWRSGVTPSPDEAARALIHHAEHDAYEPL